MSYKVLARKWRPRTFSQMVGQAHVLRALMNALDHDRLHHAYLFTGTRGVGKTTVARILAKSLNCDTGVTSAPCGVCSACTEIDEGRFVDLIEVDAASRTKVEDTRELLENVQYAPSSGRYKVYLIDEVHMLSAHSFNALLKTLEEPPPHVKFLLATTDPQRLPVTILSRCLQFNLKRLPVELIAGHLAHILHEEQITSERRALAQIARAADGSMRDALSLLDQAIAFGGGQVLEADTRAMLGTIEQGHVLELVEALSTGDGAALMARIAALDEFAPDYSGVLAELVSLLHHLAVAQTVPEALSDSMGEQERILRLAQLISPEEVQLYYQIGLLGRRDLALAQDPREGFEMTMLRMLAFRPVTDAKSPVVGPRTSAPAPAKAAKAGAAAPLADKVENSVAAAARSLDWNALVTALPLEGMVRALASNSALRQYEGDVFHLVLAPVHASLRNRNVEVRLQQALSKHLGRQVKLVFNIEQPGSETPALQRERQANDRMRAAQEAIEQDHNVKAMQELFGARIVPDSIQPLE